MKFTDWLNTHLMVCSFPFPKDFEIAGSRSAEVKTVINVSDEFTPGYAEILLGKRKIYYWLPMGEKGKGLCIENVLAACWIILQSHAEKEKVMLHCMAGKNRSVTIMDCVYYMTTGEHRPDSYEVIYKTFANNRLLDNCSRGFLPGKEKMEELLKEAHDRFVNGTSLSYLFNRLNLYL